MSCPNCESPDVTEKLAVERFQYGVDADAVMLTCMVHVLTCGACKESWLDERAEAVKDSVVRRHLENPSFVGTIQAPTYSLDGQAAPRLCPNCEKECPLYNNYCSWACMVELAKKEGGVVHAPNGLPIACIKADGTMLEHEHGDHPNYMFPVSVEWVGPKPRSKRDPECPDPEGQEYREEHETHALIFTDGSVAVTMYECCYSIWHVSGKGDCLGGWNEPKNWRMTEESRLKTLAAAQKS